MLRPRSVHRGGMTIAEVLISAAIMSVITGAVFVGVNAIRHTYVAAQHHAKSQIEQSRLIDYISRDLRRAVGSPSVEFDTNGKPVLRILIPDYYEPRSEAVPARLSGVEADVHDHARKPQIVNKTVNYGPAALIVSYHQIQDSIYRRVVRDGVTTTTPIVTDVEDFQLTYPEPDTSQVEVAVTFLPKFHFTMSDDNPNNAAYRAATTARTTVYLRNRRF